MAHDIHGNVLEVGDKVYALTTPHTGSKSKRLFYGQVIWLSSRITKVKCFENGRTVSLFSDASVVKPLE